MEDEILKIMAAEIAGENVTKEEREKMNRWWEEKRGNERTYKMLMGELKSARRIAAAVVAARSSAPIETTERLLEVVRPYINRKQEKKELAQLFQALRIEVNQEMESLRRLLEQSVELLPQGGRLVVLTYHSLEDRMVKNFMKTGNVEGRAEQDFFGRINAPLRPVNNKVIVPDEAEIERNPRSRSAKLRIAEKV